jgi:hypothetical protein
MKRTIKGICYDTKNAKVVKKIDCGTTLYINDKGKYFFMFRIKLEKKQEF